MKNNNRLYSLLAAGSLTLLLALTFLLFRGNGFSTAAGAASALPSTTVTSVVNTGSAGDPAQGSAQVLSEPQASTAEDAALTTLQAQNVQLTQMVQVMQAREQQYQSQLNAASQALQATQAQPNGQDNAGYEHSEHAFGERAEHEGLGEHD